MAPALRVISLQASNLLRLSAVDFTWEKDTPVLTIGGKNGAGKSSVVNSVAMALGGMTLCPDEPLKRGEARGFVELNLGELIVRREFWRDLLTEQPANGPPAYGETKSRLQVKNPEGVKQEPAQRLLDRLIGKLTFDPTAFAEADEKSQAEILRKIVGLDFSSLEEAHSIAYDRRAIYNKEYKDKLVILNALPKYEGVPETEVSLSAVTGELDAAQTARKAHVDATRSAMAKRQEYERSLQAQAARKADQEVIEKQIAALQSSLVTVKTSVTDLINKTLLLENVAIAAEQSAADLEKQLPDIMAINARVSEVEDTNSKIRANAVHQNLMNQVVNAQKQSEAQDTILITLVEEKSAAIRGAKYPIEGLSISHDNRVIFNDIALKQSSTAEQIRVSVAMGFALNPALKLLCVKNGNALDEDSFKMIAEAAETAGGQILMEIVTKSADDVSVFIEDGHTGA